MSSETESQLLLFGAQVPVLSLHCVPPVIGCCLFHRVRCADRWNPPIRSVLIFQFHRQVESLPMVQIHVLLHRTIDTVPQFWIGRKCSKTY